jgi:hypothetical protein
VNPLPAVHKIIRSKGGKAALACIGLLVAVWAVFSLRKPVVVVSDAAFTELYGKKRENREKFLLSLSLFRPVKAVYIAPGAGPDLISLAAWSASKGAFAAFFPYRYHEGAERYLADHPGERAAVLAGRRQMPGNVAANRPVLDPETGRPVDYGQAAAKAAAPQAGDSGGEGSQGEQQSPSWPVWVYTDVETDFYRAGFATGKLYLLAKQEMSRPKEDSEENAGEMAADGNSTTPPPPAPAPADAAEADPGEILVFTDDGLILSRGREAFILGLEESEAGAKYRFISPGWEWEGRPAACAFLAGRADAYFNSELDLPAAVYSWLDPAYLPSKAALALDDSPWALIPGALALLEEGRLEGSVPSVAKAFGTNLRGKVLNQIKTLKFSARKADN